jgi:DNA topoisomerase-1
MTKAKPADNPPEAPAGLVYVTDELPGITRLRRGKGFSYRAPQGSPLRAAEHLERIRRLAIPPAYTQVWICPLPNGHLQATGRDARGRKQYRYHASWRTARDADKFERMLAFGLALPRIRARVARDLRQPVGAHVQRHSVLAAVVRLLDTTLVRVGNDEYARTNGSYGLTTLRNRHARVTGSQLQLRFRGKSGVTHQVSLDDPRVARVVRHCQAMPGQDLFQYEDGEGALHCVGSVDVNNYLREVSGEDFTAKDFRTWHASAHALSLLCECVDTQVKARVNEVLAQVAKRLGNTVAVCRKSYVHPNLLVLAAAGELQARLEACALSVPADARRRGLNREERSLLAFLRSVHALARGEAAAAPRGRDTSIRRKRTAARTSRQAARSKQKPE